MDTPVPIPNTEVKYVTLTILDWRRSGKIGTAKFYLKGTNINLFVPFFIFITIFYNIASHYSNDLTCHDDQ